MNSLCVIFKNFLIKRKMKNIAWQVICRTASAEKEPVFVSVICESFRCVKVICQQMPYTAVPVQKLLTGNTHLCAVYTKLDARYSLLCF